MTERYDIIIIGAGHAGCEAALASARLGCGTLLITLSVETIGLMSCNPAIGGLAKGQLVKEVDALGGQMGRAADSAGIQFRQLNTKKGPAVRSSRAQTDRQAYRLYMKAVVEGQPGLTVKEGFVRRLLTGNAGAEGVLTALGERFYAQAVIVTAGTFLNGLIHIGLEHFPGGRMGDRASEELSSSLKDLGLVMGRFKTGTCPRLDGKTIDFDRMDPQFGDEKIKFFSFSTPDVPRRQLPCYITYTNQETHRIIREGFDRSPLFTGVIKGTGVRYCPSLEDKIHRFPDRDRHHVFLEPEGLNTTEYYPNGLATSLPPDIQIRMVRSIRGLERAELVRPGYGIEHDIVDPTQLLPTLETKKVAGLYLAGQINGTTGYEEAASQGLVAGINAALMIRKKEPFILKRSQSYIGVLIDDLVTKGTNEPYRMFTSRVEYRLLLREDNAHFRLTPIAHALGLIDDRTLRKTLREQETVARAVEELRTKRISPREDINGYLAEKGLPCINNPVSVHEFLRRPFVSYSDAARISDDIPDLPENIAAQVELEVKYEGFIKRQLGEIERLSKIEKIKIPTGIDYYTINSLSSEIKEKLSKIRPLTLGQASRVSGVTPAAVSILMIYLKKWQKKKAPDSVSGRPCSGAEPEKTPLYNDYSSYLKKRFGGKVHRIGIDAGFSCPNRDGTKGRGGCSFCDDKGSRARYADPSRSVSEQLATGIKTLKEAKSAEKFIAYFQAFSNTHASPSKLRGIYDAVLPFKDVVGISIGTRPDIVDDEKMALIASYSDRYDMWVEFGLQSMHDRTLALLNRRHTREDFTQAVRLTKAHAVSCAAHVILGLPGESASDMIETARFLNSTKVEGVKIHLLHILKGSPLEKEYAHGAVRILEQEEYVTIICDFIENLSPDIVIQRLTGQGSGKSHIAPAWALDKIDTINKIRAELTRRGTRQGSALGMAPSRHCEES